MVELEPGAEIGVDGAGGECNRSGADWLSGRDGLRGDLDRTEPEIEASSRISSNVCKAEDSVGVSGCVISRNEVFLFMAEVDIPASPRS